MTYDIKQITKWEAPPDNGPALLTMPNCPLPLHSLAPRTIMGRAEWDKYRKQVYVDADYTCQASGIYLGEKRTDAHEVYSVDWKNHTATFERAVALNHHLHTIFIHSGRALSLFERGDPTVPRSLMLSTLKVGFELISDWNREHYDDEPLRVSSTFLNWANNPQLERDVKHMIDHYKIKFYDFDWSCFNKHNWSKWKLIYNGKKYPTKFKNQQEWEEYFKPKTVEKPVEKDVEESNILDALLKESKDARNS